MNESESQARLARFRERFRTDTPPWYRGEYHLAFTLAVTLGTLVFCWWKIESSTVREWLLILPVAVFGNWAEWAGHRYILHRPVRHLKMIYKRHVGTHHQFFTHQDLSYKGHKDWRALLFPPFAPVAFLLVSVPPAILLGLLWSANAGYITVLTMAAYYLMYEGLHTLSHIQNSWLLDRLPLINTIRRMHVVHHNTDLMHARNFNLTFPLCDALFGTSDLDRGVLGTLFNGMSEKYVRKDDERIARSVPVPPPPDNMPPHNSFETQR
jgi:hypothetical protein